MSYTKGDLIGDRYEVINRLGEGAHGVVYGAVDRILGSKVAVKCLRPLVASEPGLKTRFMREAKLTASLSGTCAVQVYDVGKAKGGSLYIAMEFVDGVDFENYLAGIEKQGGHISVPRLREILTPIVATLEAAHEMGVVHRDLKPSNIMILKSIGRGPARLLDFGLAKDLNADPLTLEGMVPGSPSYIAPELWRGALGKVDHRADVYSLGAVVFRALTGRTPFDPTQPIFDFVVAVTAGPRPSLHKLRPDLPPRIDAWLQRALAADPSSRFQTAYESWNGFQLAAE